MGSDESGLMDAAKQDVASKIKSIVNDSDYEGQYIVSVSGKFY